jgi:hypothetical protein
MQLERNQLGQFETVSELHQKQVLDNLAMFVYDPGSLPYFNVLSSSLNEVNDMGSLMGALTLARAVTRNLFMVTQDVTTVTASRSFRENWSASPVNDPRRLELMRCAYQKEVAAHMSQPGAVDFLRCVCPDCEKRWQIFYHGIDPNLPPAPDGRVTNDCLATHTPWFGWGCKKDVPRCCPCLLVGHHCGVYVWVLPGCRDELAKLTLAILDYATNQPAPVLTKEVTLYLQKDGTPGTPQTAFRQIKAVIPANVSSLALLQSEIKTHTTGDKALDERIQSQPALPRPMEIFQPPAQPLDLQLLNQRLQQYNPR